MDHGVVPPELAQELGGEAAEAAVVLLAAAAVRHPRVHVQRGLGLRREGAQGTPQAGES